jgi:hypothetical protein
MKTQDAKNVFEKRVYFIYNPFLFLFMYEEWKKIWPRCVCDAKSAFQRQGPALTYFSQGYVRTSAGSNDFFLSPRILQSIRRHSATVLTGNVNGVQEIHL